MKSEYKKQLLAITLISLVGLAVANSVPMVIRGSATLNDSPVEAEGKVVKAFIDGEDRSSEPISIVNNSLDYPYRIAPSGNEGDNISFTIDGCLADQTIIFTSGGDPVELNLTATCPTTTTTTTTTTTSTSTTTSTTTSTSSTTTTLASTTTTLPAQEKVLINEFSPNPSDGDDWIELYNPGESQVDMSSWVLAHQTGGTTASAYTTYTIPSQTSISAGGFKILYKTQTAIDLDNSAGEILLFDETAALKDSVSYNVSDFNNSWSEIPENSSLCTNPDGELEYCQEPTPGNSNTLVAEIHIQLASGWNLISVPYNP